jgi:hypothetical protein
MRWEFVGLHGDGIALATKIVRAEGVGKIGRCVKLDGEFVDLVQFAGSRPRSGAGADDLLRIAGSKGARRIGPGDAVAGLWEIVAALCVCVFGRRSMSFGGVLLPKDQVLDKAIFIDMLDI